MIKTGLRNLLSDPPAVVRGKRIGVLVNPASVDERFNGTAELLATRFPGKLAAVFTPQHGLFAAKQDNMIESGHGVHETLKVPVYSLYSETRVPTPEMMDGMDVLLVDIQDVGTRVYTFIYTVSYCMEAAGRLGKPVVILDRPNPIGKGIEGNLLDPAFSSFVGRFPLPMRHGMTVGELCRMFAGSFGVSCELSVVPMSGYSPGSYYERTGLPWVLPSPNLPTVSSSVVYPGQVLWEGTNVSEARGTTVPFEMFGAPYLDMDAVMADLSGPEIPGAVLRPCGFEPTSNKHAGTLCKGFFLHVTDRRRFQPVRTSLALLASIFKRHPGLFAWKNPPYEYEFERLPIDLILGSDRFRKALEAGEDFAFMEKWLAGDEKEFAKLRKPYLLYGE
ncbi:MAG: DUF1343 domain-containing protein [Thermodesulfobacteriota bacterium]